MKKVIILIIMLGLFALVYQFAVNYLIVIKESEYTIVSGDIEFHVKESFQKEGNKNLYQFNIENKSTKDVFNYTIDKDFYRQNLVIKEIKRFDDNNLSCIVPVFKDNSISSIFCKYDNNIVTYSYLKQIGNNSIDNFVNQLKNEGFQSKLFDLDNSFERHEQIDVSLDFPSEYGATVWYGNSFYAVQRDKFKEVILFNKKRTSNPYAALAGDHYVTVDTDLTDKYDTLYILNARDGLKDFIYLDPVMSNNIYFAGVIGNKVYIVDKTNRKEYEVNATKKTIKEVGNDNLGTAIYYDGKKKLTVGLDEMINQDKYFAVNLDVPELTQKYGNVEIRESNKKYYFKTPTGEVWYVLKKDLDHPVKLFNFPDFKEWKVKGDSVFGISADTVYMYNDQVGLKPIIRDRELTYNYHNIYDIYEK